MMLFHGILFFLMHRRQEKKALYLFLQVYSDFQSMKTDQELSSSWKVCVDVSLATCLNQENFLKGFIVICFKEKLLNLSVLFKIQ